MVDTGRLGAVIAATTFVAACGGSPTAPTTASSLPLGGETATMRYYHEPGDTIDITRQEAFNAWAIERLGLVLPQKVEYRKYFSGEAMARYTGTNTNGFAEPSLWRFHTIWPFDNHEVVHVYTAVVGRPSDFFNEGNVIGLIVNGATVDEVCRSFSDLKRSHVYECLAYNEDHRAEIDDLVADQMRDPNA